MSCIRSSPRCTDSGFSLIELLMAGALAGISLMAVAQFFAIQSRQQVGHTYRVETQQALRASLDSMTRDLRLAGACLPIDGDYVALAGADVPGNDSVTVRAGVVRTDLSCVVTALTALTASGSASLTVTSAAGFAPNMLAYLRHPGGTGQFSFVASAASTSVVLADAATIDFPVGSGLFAVDERTYTLDTTGPDPQLILTVDRGAPQAFAVGIIDLQLRYALQQNCPPCDVVDLPPDDETWRLVNEVFVTATARTVGAARPEDQVSLTETSRAKPRNLLP